MISMISVFRIRSDLFRADLWELTRKSYRTLLNTADQEFELIVIDNGSHDPAYANELRVETSTWNLQSEYIRGIRILRLEEPQALSKAWNIGVGQADGDYLIIANNDVIYFESGWMSKLIEPFSWTERKIGIVGIQHMSWYKFSFCEGSLFTIPKSFVEKFKLGDSEDDSHYPILFDERFTLSCEDVDFNRRVQDAGYETIQVNDPPLQPRWLQHLGHRTIQSMAGTDEDIIQISHENRIRLCQKYGYDERIVD